jgi:hypothetical protein
VNHRRRDAGFRGHLPQGDGLEALSREQLARSMAKPRADGLAILFGGTSYPRRVGALPAGTGWMVGRHKA